MIQNKFGEQVFADTDVCNVIMQGREIDTLHHMVVDASVDLAQLIQQVEQPESLLTWRSPCDDSVSVAEFHVAQQSVWHMPEEYKTLDIAQHVLSLCQTEAELQRCGAELLLYQERGLFDLLRYLKYLVDIMASNQVIWGVGRGSSVASYVLYLLRVHRINSMYYNLDIAEFLR